ncbi:S-locus glycoprotein domain, Bulb-type lectin domain, PAN/Apple domain protein [Artemisia annua]|uniref:S-locus glycoprotein domain, Bulb-type lectin domain, PAN/Apple domain protein n=1 Tax=Artemisia annua TaxID=35608 RepID=A0A2U1NEM6_ARTAN|nr:S-locus glycoprotein domain, Bulb-type lectin domain, PAN/Apple domain protein [Artemisia annua]
MSSSYSTFIISICFQLLFFISRATVPTSETFTYVNEGEFEVYVVEYDANYRNLGQFRNPVTLCFYNTTPNAFTLALRMGTVFSEAQTYWVWEANRGKPVKENATLTLGTDGNLVLAEADGRVVWETNTANKGVVGFELLPNGNMVLHDGKGNYIWQSFDSPTDTLLVGQGLRANGVSKLVSRASVKNNSDGPYSFVLESRSIALYYKNNNSPRPMVYWSFSPRLNNDTSTFVNLTLISEPRYDYDFIIYYLNFVFEITNLDPLIEDRPRGDSVVYKKNNTLTYLRLGIDGSLRYFTFTINMKNINWDRQYYIPDRDSRVSRVSECQLPDRCGKFGLCEDNQCVACPTPNGLSGWSKDCDVKKVTSCKASDFHYYKLQGVDHFTIKYTRGDETNQRQCENKCSSDCTCMGYFYHTDRSRCWIAYDLKTLTRVENSTNLAYIKTPNK